MPHSNHNTQTAKRLPRRANANTNDKANQEKNNKRREEENWGRRRAKGNESAMAGDRRRGAMRELTIL